MAKPIVPIIMGSKSDLDHAKKIASTLAEFGIESDLRVGSAHKVASYLLGVLNAYENDGRPKIYITSAGRSNALSGLVDAHVSAPVIACPPPSQSFGGADIYSSIRMPSWVAPALILDPGNAALFAAKVFGIHSPDAKKAVADRQEFSRQQVLQADEVLN
jgi:5-(carboxyamino)imidazole ribonucleotide mutase